LQLIQVFEVADREVRSRRGVEDALRERASRFGSGFSTECLKAESAPRTTPPEVQEAIQILRTGGLAPAILVLITPSDIVVPPATRQAADRRFG
jgi:hypothetical protein